MSYKIILVTENLKESFNFHRIYMFEKMLVKEEIKSFFLKRSVKKAVINNIIPENKNN